MKYLVGLCFLLFCIPAFASTDCQSTFAVGKFSFCVTENGNIAHVGFNGDFDVNGAEGYGICTPEGDSYDLGALGDSGNWYPPVITQPHGPNTFPITILRGTTDNLYSITQQFSFAKGGTRVQVKTTALTFQTFKTPIRFVRYADFSGLDPNSDFADSLGLGLTWNRSEFGGFTIGAMLNQSQMLSVQIVPGKASDPCSVNPVASLPFQGDSAVLMSWPWYGGKLKMSFDYTPMQ